MLEALTAIDTGLVADLVKFAKEHPGVAVLVAGWLTTAEGLPFFKKSKANGVLHAVWLGLVALAETIVKINQLRRSGKDGENVGTGA